MTHGRTKITLPIQEVLKDFAQPEICAPQTLTGELLRRLTLLAYPLATTKEPIRVNQGHLEVHLQTKPSVPFEQLTAEIYQRTFDLGIRQVTCTVATTKPTMEPSKHLDEQGADSISTEAMLLALKASFKEQKR